MGEGKEICVEGGVEVLWRWGTNDNNDGIGGTVAIIITVSLQNMSITQRPLWIDDVKRDEL